MLNGSFLLVGGSGGLGQATARLLASEGAKLTVTYYRDRGRAEAARGAWHVTQADITKQTDRTKILDEAGVLDGLVVFTGNPARVARAEDTEAQMQVSHAVNYAGPLLLAREAGDRMRQANKQGSIVLFSTMQGVALFSQSTVYAGAKAALVHGARILAKELRSANIRVNVIAPGIIQAGMAEASIASGKYDKYLADQTIARFGRAEDVAKTVRFLLEPDNYITGQVISVDGGITL